MVKARARDCSPVSARACAGQTATDLGRMVDDTRGGPGGGRQMWHEQGRSGREGGGTSEEGRADNKEGEGKENIYESRKNGGRK